METLLFLLALGAFAYFFIFTEKGQEVWARVKAWFGPIDGGGSRPPPSAMLAGVALLGALLIGSSASAQRDPSQCGPYSAVVEIAEQNSYHPQVSWSDDEGDKFVIFANKARKVVVVVVYKATSLACLSGQGADFTVEKKRNET